MASRLKLLLRTGDGTGGGGGGTGGGSGDVITDQFFGMHIGNPTPTSIWADYDPSAENYPAGNYRQTPWPDAMRFGSYRTWDANGCYARNILRFGAAPDWSRSDFVVNQAFDKGNKITFTLGGGCPDEWTAPDYGQATAEYGLPINNHVGFNPYAPVNLADWEAWVTAVVTRYTGKVAEWEIWNEVNDGFSWVGYRGTLARLIELCASAYAIIKSIDPTATVLSPNFTGSGLIATSPDSVTFDNFVAAGGTDHCDVIALHGYNSLAPYPQPESIFQHAKVAKAILKRFGVAKPIWNNEWGGLQYVDGDGVVVADPVPAMETMRAAGIIARMILCSWLAGYRRYYHYALDWLGPPNSIFMVDPDSPGTLIAPAAAWTYLANLLTGGKLSGLTTARGDNGQSYYSARFTTGSGQRGRAYWMIDHPRQLAGPIGTSIAMPAGVTEIRNVVGVAQTIGATLTIGGEPQYLFLEAA